MDMQMAGSNPGHFCFCLTMPELLTRHPEVRANARLEG